MAPPHPDDGELLVVCRARVERYEKLRKFNLPTRSSARENGIRNGVCPASCALKATRKAAGYP
jgi:hypothetical protein